MPAHNRQWQVPELGSHLDFIEQLQSLLAFDHENHCLSKTQIAQTTERASSSRKMSKKMFCGDREAHQREELASLSMGLSLGLA